MLQPYHFQIDQRKHIDMVNHEVDRCLAVSLTVEDRPVPVLKPDTLTNREVS
jgi:hypothetical protein